MFERTAPYFIGKTEPKIFRLVVGRERCYNEIVRLKEREYLVCVNSIEFFVFLSHFKVFRMNLEISFFDVLPAGFSFISKLHQNENSFQPRKYIQLC